MYCIKCGKELSDNDKYCSNCGTPAGGNQTASGSTNVSSKKKRSGCLTLIGWGFIIEVFFLGWALITVMKNISIPHPQKPLESYGISTSEVAKKMNELPVKVKFPVYSKSDSHRELMEIMELDDTCDRFLTRSERHWEKSFKQIRPKDLFKNCVCSSTTYILREKLHDGTLSKSSRDDSKIMLDIIKNLVEEAMFACKLKIEKKM